MSEELPFNDRLKTYSEWKKEMMDDSLNDTQQEKKQMSVEELVLKDEVNNSIKIRRGDVGFILNIKDMNGPKNAFLTKEHAHMLMLYLQQHLGYVSISKERLE